MAQVDQALLEVLEEGPLTVIPSEHMARAGGRALMLSIRELELLTELVRRADRIVAREELFALVWGREMPVRGRSVDVYIRKLRVKLAAAAPDWRFIHTHVRLGYRLAAEPAGSARFTVGSHDVYTDGPDPAETLGD
ncbi:MAG: winged helix-turn-helix domain-containing protein [Solirubrobacteraceae bacterium]